jgi:hypothetical protein
VVKPPGRKLEPGEFQLSAITPAPQQLAAPDLRVVRMGTALAINPLRVAAVNNKLRRRSAAIHVWVSRIWNTSFNN